MKKQKENSHEGITWSEMEKQNVQAKEVYSEEYGQTMWLAIEGRHCMEPASWKNISY